MKTSDGQAPDGPAPAATVRPDVLTARSRMRTKYGSKAQINHVAAMLGTDEVLLLLAVVEGQDPGVLALTDERLVFVPHAPDHLVRTFPLVAVRSLTWRPGSGSGTLTVVLPDASTSFDRLANADGRDLTRAVAQLNPGIGPLAPG